MLSACGVARSVEFSACGIAWVWCYQLVVLPVVCYERGVAPGCF